MRITKLLRFVGAICTARFQMKVQAGKMQGKGSPMTEFAPVRTVSDLKSLEEGDVLEGYLDGVSGYPEPGSDRSRGYWHGWRNGRVDAGLADPDLARVMLDAAFAARIL